MYQKIFFDVLEVSMTVSGIILLALLILPAIDKRYGFRWRKLLWLILAVRLLIPYHFTLPNTPIHLFQSEKIVVQDGGKIYFKESSDQNNVLTKEISKKAETKEITEAFNDSEDAFQIPLLELVGIIWGIGAFIYLRNQQINYHYFLEHLEESTPVKAGEKYELLNEVCTALHIKKVPELYLNQTVTTPFIIGFWKPVLFLPMKRFTKKELEFIYRHECTHYKNHDMQYKLLITIAVGIHWFNPIVRYMKTLAFRDVEMVCDQKMSVLLSREERKLYCNVLIHTASGSSYKEPDLSTSFLGNKKILKQRIQNIFDFRKRKKGVFPIVFILGIMFLGGSFISCGKYVKIPKQEVVKQEETKEGKKEEPKQEKKQEQIPYTLTLDDEQKKDSFLEKPNQIEDLYCRSFRDYTGNYEIDEQNVLWKNGQKIAEDVVHFSPSMSGDECALFYVTASGALYLDSQTTPVMQDVSYVICTSTSVNVLKKDGSVWVWGEYRVHGYTETDLLYPNSGDPVLFYEEPTCIMKDAVFLTAVYGRAAAITREGDLWLWGGNLYGECGLTDASSDIAKPGKRMEDVEAVYLDENVYRTYVKKTDGTLWACGKDVGNKTKRINYGPDAIEQIQTKVYSSVFMPLILHQ